MTGFASHQYPLEEGLLNIQIRAVNCRYMEMQFVIDEPLQSLELDLQKLLKQVVQRGKLDITVSLVRNNQKSLQVNTAKLSQLSSILEQINHIVPQGKIELTHLLSFPGILQEPNLELTDSLKQKICECFKDCLERFDASRRDEGEHLAKVIAEKLQVFDSHLEQIAKQLHNLTFIERDRILYKINQLKVELDAHRLEQEVAIWAQKSDIAEEYDRLRSHTATIKNLLSQPLEVNGKRLDFVSQELLRESNTTAAKAGILAIVKTVVELKVLSEQIREQVQNIE